MVSTEIVKQFFLQLRKSAKERKGCLDNETKKLIEQYPTLLESTCPDGEDLGEWPGKTVTECICTEETSPDSRDVLWELVERGATATEKCYRSIMQEDVFVDHLAVLLASGQENMPLVMHGQYFLDKAVRHCDDASGRFDEIMKLLHPEKVKAGDQFSFGTIKADMVENLRDLPELEAGVTHAEGGPFDELEKEMGWQKEEPQKENKKEQRPSNAEEQEEEPPKKKKKEDPPSNTVFEINTDWQKYL